MTKSFLLISLGTFFMGGLAVAQTEAVQLLPTPQLPQAVSSAAPAQQPNRAAQTVIAQGVGKDIESAAKNAAENALIQVVGSFVQSDKFLTKRSEINDGIRRESRSIDTKTREYSQGSIKSFDLLDTSQNDGFFRVSARVEVRIEDFKAFVQKIAEGETQVDAGIFAGLATNENNRKELTNIIAESIVLPVLRGSAINISVGKPELFENWEQSTQAAELKRTNRLSLVSKSTIVIPVTAEINRDFLDNAISTLNNIASSKLDVQNGAAFPHAYDLDKDGVIWIYNQSGVSQLYSFKNMFISQRNKSLKNLEDCIVNYALSPGSAHVFYFTAFEQRNPQCAVPNLKVSFSDGNQEIYASYINPVQDDNNWYRGRSPDGKMQLVQRWRNISSPSSLPFGLVPKREFFIFATLAPEELQIIKKMTVSIR